MFYLREVRTVLSEAGRRESGDGLMDFIHGIEENSIKYSVDEFTEAGCIVSGGTLWITDMADIAEKLVARGCAVLAYLHQDNRQENFAMCQYACESLSEETDAVYLDRVYRRCKGLPWDILGTAHCLVRETTVADVEDFYRIYSEPSITEYMDRLYEDPEEERAYAQDYIDQVYCFYNFGIWTVVERESGEVIGRAGICCREGYETPELGFVIGVPWQGRGYATEVCQGILEYAGEELGMTEVLAFVQPGNLASIHVCDKLSMGYLERVELQGQEYIVRVWNAAL